MTFPVPLAFAAQIALAVLAALVAGGSPARRTMAAALLLVSAVVPWLVPPGPFWRALLSVAPLVAFLKTTQIAFTPGPWPVGRRLWHLVVLFDVRQTRRITPRVDWSLVGDLSGHALLVIVAVMLVGYADMQAAVPRRALRLLGGIGMLYGILGGLSVLYQVVHRMLGIDAPANQRAPILSRTAAEFWSERWNRTISEWLARFAFRPVSRRFGTAVGLLAAFAVSGLLHVWLASAALGLRAALLMGSYFVIEGVILLAEFKLGVRRWPALLARAWTMAVLLLPLLLPMDGFLRVFGY